MTEPARKIGTCGAAGGRRADGKPCERPSGWGTGGAQGRCSDHPDGQAAAIGASRPPEAPAHLSRAAAERWRAILRDWILSPSELLLLEEGLAAWDRVRRCRQTLQAEGFVVTNPDSGHQKRHPAATELDQSLTQLRNCFKQLEME